MELELLRRETWSRIVEESRRRRKQAWGGTPIELFFEEHSAAAPRTRGSSPDDPVFPFDSLGDQYAAILKDFHARRRGVAADKGEAVSVKKTSGRVTLKWRDETISMAGSFFARMRRLHAGDPESFRADLFRCMFRYGYLGLLGSGMSGSVLPELIRKLHRESGVADAVECFGSFFNHTLPAYCGLFPDIEAGFGCIGNFFRVFDARTMSGKFLLVNPPFTTSVIHRVFDMFAAAPLAGSVAVIVLPAWETADRELLNRRCDRRQNAALVTDYASDMRRLTRSDAPSLRWCALYCKSDFPYMNLATGARVNYTATKVYVLSTLPDERRTAGVIRAMPESGKDAAARRPKRTSGGGGGGGRRLGLACAVIAMLAAACAPRPHV